MLMAASFVDNGGTVCDVGCDHGKLSLYLVQRGKARQIIATDINAQPLQKAVDLFASHDLSHTATFLLTDGLQGIENTEDITHVVIAGLGGHTMAQVIENAPFIKENKVQLVLLPAQSGYFVRKFLYENGYTSVFWSMAYDDWDNSRQMNPGRAKEKLLSTTHDGAILLLHPTSATNAAILGDLIREWKNMGYSFGSLKEI